MIFRIEFSKEQFYTAKSLMILTKLRHIPSHPQVINKMQPFQLSRNLNYARLLFRSRRKLTEVHISDL